MDQDNCFLIEPVVSEQASDLSDLCLRIYPQYFTYLWDDAGAWYMDYSYNAARLKAELEDPNVRYFWAVSRGERVGYLKLNLTKELPLSNEQGGLEIERIYFLSGAAGQGLGTRLIDYAEAIARQQQKAYIWLHTMDSSQNSIAFYEKRGFGRVGETILPFSQMKPHLRRMWQMKKTLA